MALPPDPHTHTRVLGNGLRVVVIENAYPPDRVAAWMDLNFGSLAETPEERGLAHFLEHLLFVRTQELAGREKMKEALLSLSMSDKADANAFTDWGNTVYTLQGPWLERQQAAAASEAAAAPSTKAFTLPRLLWLLHQMCFRAEFHDEPAFHLEKGAVVSEAFLRRSLNSRLEDTVRLASHHENLLPFRLPIGSIDVVQRASPAAIKALYDKWYRPELMTLYVSGPLGGYESGGGGEGSSGVPAVWAVIERLFGSEVGRGPCPLPSITPPSLPLPLSNPNPYTHTFGKLDHAFSTPPHFPFLVLSHPLLTSFALSVSIKKPLDTYTLASVDHFREGLIDTLLWTVFDARMTALLSRYADPPFSSAFWDDAPSAVEGCGYTGLQVSCDQPTRAPRGRKAGSEDDEEDGAREGSDEEEEEAAEDEEEEDNDEAEEEQEDDGSIAGDDASSSEEDDGLGLGLDDDGDEAMGNGATAGATAGTKRRRRAGPTAGPWRWWDPSCRWQRAVALVLRELLRLLRHGIPSAELLQAAHSTIHAANERALAEGKTTDHEERIETVRGAIGSRSVPLSAVDELALVKGLLTPVLPRPAGSGAAAAAVPALPAASSPSSLAPHWAWETAAEPMAAFEICVRERLSATLQWAEKIVAAATERLTTAAAAVPPGTPPSALLTDPAQAACLDPRMCDLFKGIPSAISLSVFAPSSLVPTPPPGAASPSPAPGAPLAPLYPTPDGDGVTPVCDWLRRHYGARWGLSPAEIEDDDGRSGKLVSLGGLGSPSSAASCCSGGAHTAPPSPASAVGPEGEDGEDGVGSSGAAPSRIGGLRRVGSAANRVGRLLRLQPSASSAQLSPPGFAAAAGTEGFVTGATATAAVQEGDVEPPAKRRKLADGAFVAAAPQRWGRGTTPVTSLTILAAIARAGYGTLSAPRSVAVPAALVEPATLAAREAEARALTAAVAASVAPGAPNGRDCIEYGFVAVTKLPPSLLRQYPLQSGTGAVLAAAGVKPLKEGAPDDGAPPAETPAWLRPLEGPEALPCGPDGFTPPSHVIGERGEIPRLPPPGPHRLVHPALGFVTLRLSNGVTVKYMPSKREPGSVTVLCSARGGKEEEGANGWTCGLALVETLERAPPAAGAAGGSSSSGSTVDNSAETQQQQQKQPLPPLQQVQTAMLHHHGQLVPPGAITVGSVVGTLDVWAPDPLSSLQIQAGTGDDASALPFTPLPLGTMRSGMGMWLAGGVGPADGDAFSRLCGLWGVSVHAKVWTHKLGIELSSSLGNLGLEQCLHILHAALFDSRWDVDAFKRTKAAVQRGLETDPLEGDWAAGAVLSASVNGTPLPRGTTTYFGPRFPAVKPGVMTGGSSGGGHGGSGGGAGGNAPAKAGTARSGSTSKRKPGAAAAAAATASTSPVSDAPRPQLQEEGVDPLFYASQVTHEAARSYIQHALCSSPQNMCITVIGDFDWETLEAGLLRYVAPLLPKAWRGAVVSSGAGALSLRLPVVSPSYCPPPIPGCTVAPMPLAACRDVRRPLPLQAYVPAPAELLPSSLAPAAGSSNSATTPCALEEALELSRRRGTLLASPDGSSDNLAIAEGVLTWTLLQPNEPTTDPSSSSSLSLALCGSVVRWDSDPEPRCALVLTVPTAPRHSTDVEAVLAAHTRSWRSSSPTGHSDDVTVNRFGDVMCTKLGPLPGAPGTSKAGHPEEDPPLLLPSGLNHTHRLFLNRCETLLAGILSNRLHRQLRENSGLCYYASFNGSGGGGGAYPSYGEVDATVTPGALSAALHLALATVWRFYAGLEPPTPNELAEVARPLIPELSAQPLCSDHWLGLLSGLHTVCSPRSVQPGEWLLHTAIAVLGAVTSADLAEAARRSGLPRVVPVHAVITATGGAPLVSEGGSSSSSGSDDPLSKVAALLPTRWAVTTLPPSQPEARPHVAALRQEWLSVVNGLTQLPPPTGAQAGSGAK